MRMRWGSSPRMRGKRRGRPGHGAAGGFIPAHAGKTCSSTLLLRRPRVHPRACGENFNYGEEQGFEPGSSPRMRGKHGLPPRDHVGPGFIPAHAGKTRQLVFGKAPVQVHPRACGENLVKTSPAALGPGSSPRMRGKRRAGRRKKPGYGSSPRMRGKPPHPLAHAHPRGFIPAHAGKTGAFPHHGPAPPVHPRACGENDIIGMADMMEEGSSPRMRGKLRRGSDRLRPGRFIPAHAEKTRACSSTWT